MSGEAHFEVYPQRSDDEDRKPTGQYGWRLRSANGQIVAAGGEGFGSRRGAKKAVTTAAQTMVDLALAAPDRSAAPGHALNADELPIIDVDD